MKDHRDWHHEMIELIQGMTVLQIVGLYAVAKFLIWHRKLIRKFNIDRRSPYHWPQRQKFLFQFWRRRFHVWVSVEVVPK